MTRHRVAAQGLIAGRPSQRVAVTASLPSWATQCAGQDARRKGEGWGVAACIAIEQGEVVQGLRHLPETAKKQQIQGERISGKEAMPEPATDSFTGPGSLHVNRLIYKQVHPVPSNCSSRS